MDTIGFSQSEQEEVFHIIAAVLHVGNVTFKQEGSYGKVSSHEAIKTAAHVSHESQKFWRSQNTPIPYEQMKNRIIIA
jgi:myosin heavy subunit